MATLDWYVRRVRRQLDDHDPERLNPVDGYQEKWTDDDLMQAVEDALLEINDTPPETAHTVESFSWTSVLVKGAVIAALRQAAIRDTKNRLSTNDAGLTVASGDNASMYLTLVQHLMPEYQRLVLKIKGTAIPRKPGSGFVVISSPYAGFQ